MKRFITKFSNMILYYESLARWCSTVFIDGCKFSINNLAVSIRAITHQEQTKTKKQTNLTPYLLKWIIFEFKFNFKIIWTWKCKLLKCYKTSIATPSLVSITWFDSLTSQFTSLSKFLPLQLYPMWLETKWSIQNLIYQFSYLLRVSSVKNRYMACIKGFA